MDSITINNNDKTTTTVNVNTNDMSNFNANAMNPHGIDQSLIFDSWMFEKQNVDIDNLELNNINTYNENTTNNYNDLNNFSTENDSSSWFEPLENILSSTSSSSINSPSELMNFDSTTFNDPSKNFNDPIFNNDTNMTTTTASTFNDPNDPQNINNNTNNDDNIFIKNEMPPLLLNSSKSKVTNSKPIKKRLTQHQKDIHNKIEKRYRISINTKIAKLQQIIPWVASENSSPETTKPSNTDSSNNDNSSNSIPKPAARLNKSMILEKAVDYILYLQNNERLFEMEVMRLKNELEVVKKNGTKKQLIENH